MNFHETDIRRFLLDSIPDRFGHLSPGDFTALIRYLFEVDGFDVDPGPMTSGAIHVLVATKDRISHAILPLLATPGIQVDEHLFEQANSAREVNETDQAWIITTGMISAETKSLAEDFDIELWDWDALYAALCQLFFEGKSHDEYFQKNINVALPEEQPPVLKLKAKWKPLEGVSAEWYNLGLTISNPTQENIYIHLQLPALIDQKRQQIMAEQWGEGEFVSGLIYAGASVHTNALFSVAKAGDKPPGGRIMLTCFERTDVPVTYHLQTRLQGDACYVVTYCYTRQSHEYAEMIAFRDDVLSQSQAGRLFTKLYYQFSPHLVTLASQVWLADKVLRRLTQSIVQTILAFRRRRV